MVNKEYDPFNEFVEAYARKGFLEAFAKVEKERNGKGCGCPQCCRQAVEDINAWVTFETEADVCLLYRYDPYKRRIIPPDWSGSFTHYVEEET
jgi:hypothetical protein